MQSTDGFIEQAARLAILHQRHVSSAATDANLGHIVNALAKTLNVPISSLTRLDSDQEWLWHSVGLESAVRLSRELGFAARSLPDDEVFEVDDARADERLRENPLVAGPPFVRWCAMSPLSLRGHRIGALCAMDTVARCMTSSERSLLTRFDADVSTCTMTRPASTQTVVISGYNIPGDNGIDVLKAVVALRPGVSVALISGCITDAMRDEAVGGGISEIVFKPDSPQELVAAMRRLLRNKPSNSP